MRHPPFGLVELTRRADHLSRKSPSHPSRVCVFESKDEQQEEQQEEQEQQNRERIIYVDSTDLEGLKESIESKCNEKVRICLLMIRSR